MVANLRKNELLIKSNKDNSDKNIPLYNTPNLQNQVTLAFKLKEQLVNFMHWDRGKMWVILQTTISN